MKYMILLFGAEDGWETMTEDEIAADLRRHEDFAVWCAENGIAITGGAELQPSATAYTALKSGGETDGPFLEIKEQLGGAYIIETDSLELAKEAARRTPNYGANELRPIMNRDE